MKSYMLILQRKIKMNRGIPERDTPDLRLGGMNMYDIEKRRFAANITVGDFCKYLLEHVPADAVFHVGGMSHFYLHVDRGNQAVSVDDSDLSGDEDYADYADYPIKKIGGSP